MKKKRTMKWKWKSYQRRSKKLNRSPRQSTWTAWKPGKTTKTTKSKSTRKLKSLFFKANELKSRRKTVTKIVLTAKGDRNSELFDVVFGKYRGPQKTIALKGGESVTIAEGVYYSVRNKKDKAGRLGMDIYFK